MILDCPEKWVDILPGFFEKADPICRQFVPAGFAAALMAEMGVSGLLQGEASLADEAPDLSFWQDLFLLVDSPRSQYDALRQATSLLGAPPGNLACVALNGKNFHGQHDRHWAVAEGNLHLSVVLPCELPVDEFAAVMPALPAVAVVEAVSKLGAGRLRPGIKWVNDVLLAGQKVAGVLTSLRTHRGRITEVFLGVGLNVEVAPDLVGDHLALDATSLRDQLPAASPSLELVLRTMLSSLATRFTALQQDGPADLLASYREHSLVVGRTVEIWPEGEPASGPQYNGPQYRGEVLAIEPDLNLRLAGVPDPINTGRLKFAPPGT